jgi:hypothetical protein
MKVNKYKLKSPGAWVPSCTGRQMSRGKKREDVGLKYKRMYWLMGRWAL